MRMSKVDKRIRRNGATLNCEVCGMDLTQGYDGTGDSDIRQGEHWLYWTHTIEEGGKTGPIQHIGLRCSKCHRGIDRFCRQNNLYVSDGYLEWFGGLRALGKAFHLLRDYEWSDKARDELLDIFIQLQLLPTSNMDTSWMSGV